MKNKYVFTAVLLLCILAASLGLTAIYTEYEGLDAKEDDILVVTSFYPMYIATENIVKDIDGVTLKNLSEPQTGCLHDFQLTPEDMRLLAKADVFVINGGGIETFMTDVASAYPDLKIIDACENVTLLESTGGHEHEEHGHEEHSHEEGEDKENAHAWMSISAYRTQVGTIADKLAEYDKDHAEVYRMNRDHYEEKLAQLQEEQEQVAELLNNEKVILFHEAYAYLADDLGLESCYLLNLDEERAVSAGEVAEVLEEIDENQVSLVLAEERYGSNLGELVASESGAKILYLDTLNRGEYDADSYLNGMQENLALIRDWIQEGE